MSQQCLIVNVLPESGLAANAAFVKEYLASARQILEKPGTSALAIVLPKAPFDHDDWRRALALDLAREYAPKRVNIVSVSEEDARLPMLAYLRNASGVTGQYLQTHE